MSVCFHCLPNSTSREATGLDATSQLPFSPTCTLSERNGMDFPGSIAISGLREVSPIVKMRERGMYMVQSIHVFLAGDKPAGLTWSPYVMQMANTNPVRVHLTCFSVVAAPLLRTDLPLTFPPFCSACFFLEAFSTSHLLKLA